ncbi:hypothetical protein LINPERHAP1_LOCUS24961, partial [Linum perenne]
MISPRSGFFKILHKVAHRMIGINTLSIRRLKSLRILLIGTKQTGRCKRRTIMVALDPGRGTLRKRLRQLDGDRRGVRCSSNSIPPLMERSRMRMQR